LLAQVRPQQFRRIVAFVWQGVDPLRDLQEALFKTTNDADNRASVAATSTAALDLVGLGLHADRKTADKITGGLKFLT
jgi:hypothetical protein